VEHPANHIGLAAHGTAQWLELDRPGRIKTAAPLFVQQTGILSIAAKMAVIKLTRAKKLPDQLVDSGPPRLDQVAGHGSAPMLWPVQVAHHGVQTLAVANLYGL